MAIKLNSRVFLSSIIVFGLCWLACRYAVAFEKQDTSYIILKKNEEYKKNGISIAEARDYPTTTYSKADAPLPIGKFRDFFWKDDETVIYQKKIAVAAENIHEPERGRIISFNLRSLAKTEIAKSAAVNSDLCYNAVTHRIAFIVQTASKENGWKIKFKFGLLGEQLQNFHSSLNEPILNRPYIDPNTCEFFKKRADWRASPSSQHTYRTVNQTKAGTLEEQHISLTQGPGPRVSFVALYLRDSDAGTQTEIFQGHARDISISPNGCRAVFLSDSKPFIFMDSHEEAPEMRVTALDVCQRQKKQISKESSYAR